MAVSFTDIQSVAADTISTGKNQVFGEFKNTTI